MAMLVGSRAIPRVLLTSCAALLHGFDTRTDPLLNALIVAYSMEQITQNMALAALALVDDVMGNEVTEIEGSKWLDGGVCVHMTCADVTLTRSHV